MQMTAVGLFRLGAESFFFQEGHAERYEQAKYGDLRVTGERDAARQPL